MDEKKLSIEEVRKRLIEDLGYDPFSLMSDENMIKWFENPRASSEPTKDE